MNFIAAVILLFIFLIGMFWLIYSQEIKPTLAANTNPPKNLARNYLSNLKCGDSVIVLVKDDYQVKHCTVTANMPSIKKIELRFKIIEIWHRIYDYSEIENGILDLNNVSEIPIEKEPFLS